MTKQIVDALKGKFSKTEVNYTDKSTSKDYCSICIHFEPPSSCEGVAGKINPNGWCKRFKNEKA